MRKQKNKFTILMPAYNENETIIENLRETCRFFKEAKYDFEVIVIDDGSKDHTWRKLKKAVKGYPQVKIKRHYQNHGKGRALKFGARFAEGNYIAFLDADLELHPRQLVLFYRWMQEQKADVVIGSKWHPDSVINYPMVRGVISRIYYFMVKVLFQLPVRDTQTGLKLFKAEVLKKIFPLVLVKKYAFDLEILVNVKRLGYKMVEAPVEILFRRKDPVGRIRWRDLQYTFVDTMAIFYRLYYLKYYQKKEKELDSKPVPKGGK